MFNHTKQLLIITSVLSTPLVAKNIVDDFFEAKKGMEKAHTRAKKVMTKVDAGITDAKAGLAKAGQELKKAGEEVKQAIVSVFEPEIQITMNENSTHNAVVVTVKGIKATNIDATINDENDTLSIKADATEVTIIAKERMLTVGLRHAIPAGKIKNDNKEIQTFSYQSMQESRTIAGTILLDKQSITYDQTTQLLTITLPRMEIKKAGKPVPVTVIPKAETPATKEVVKDQAPTPLKTERSGNQN